MRKTSGFDYGWVVVAAGALMTCVGFGSMLSLAVFLQPISEGMGWSRAGVSAAATLDFLFMAVAAVFWGEMGREPLITPNPGRTPGQGHWPQAGFALMLGGSLKMGQVVGASDARGAEVKGKAITPQMMLATLYHTLGIDPATTIPDHNGRPMYLLDEREPIRELI